MNHYNLFISHAWRYSDHYWKVVSWLDEAKEASLFTWSNYSVPKHDPLIDPSTPTGKKKLQGMLNDQMRPASKVIIMSGMYAQYSDWIQFETLLAVEMKKYIIGLKPWGQERIPSLVQDYATEIVGWNRDSLLRAIVS